ncbi:MAG TPA: hypothetical protein PK876_02725 [Elusimicrobiota bacterium]|nr:hypothetical protein [Elusimicrobiota bacterium]
MLTVMLASPHEAPGYASPGDPSGQSRVLVTGIKNRSFPATDILLEGDGHHYLNAGFAGSLHPDWKAGTVFLAETVVGETGDVLETSPVFNRLILRTFHSQRVSCRIGRLLTVSVPVEDALLREELRHRFQADAVDMEAHGLLTQLKNSIHPVSVVKIISDQADEQAEGDYRENTERLSRRLGMLLTFIRKGLDTVS